MTAPSAWTIQAALALANAALQRLDQAGVETDAAALAAYLAQEAPEVDAVLLRLLRAQDEAARESKVLADRIEDLSGRRGRFDRRHAEYRIAIAGIMETLGLTKWHHAEYTASLYPGRPGVVVTDSDALPDAFVRVTRAPDKAAIKDALEAGEAVPGAELANGMPTLTIRSK